MSYISTAVSRIALCKVLSKDFIKWTVSHVFELCTSSLRAQTLYYYQYSVKNIFEYKKMIQGVSYLLVNLILYQLDQCEVFKFSWLND